MKPLFGALRGKAKTGASKVKGWLKNRKEAFENIKKGSNVNVLMGDALLVIR